MLIDKIPVPEVKELTWEEWDELTGGWVKPLELVPEPELDFYASWLGNKLREK
jgi:hypothetical protein